MSSDDPPPRIRLVWPAGEATALPGPAGVALLARLPLAAEARTWGEEVCFPAPFAVDPGADDQEVVEPGTVCYWRQGQALALPFGATPGSRAGECRLLAPCAIIGRLEQDARLLASVRRGDPIPVEPAGRPQA